MKVRDLLNMEIDIDVYDDVCEELGIAFCGPLYLTDAGKNQFAEVLDYEIKFGSEYDNGYVTVCIDDADDKVWKRRLKKAKAFFESAAGYCDAGDWDRWFSDEPIKEQEKPVVSETVNSERSRTLTVTLHVEDEALEQVRDNANIIQTRDGWGGNIYELLVGQFHRERIYRPESSAPYMLIDGERVNLLPFQRKVLKKVMKGLK